MFGFGCFSQNSEWKNINCNSGVLSIAEEPNFIWVGTVDSGLARIDKSDYSKVYFNTNNSSLPNNQVTSIIVDSMGRKWIATLSGVAKLDGLLWRNYYKSNSGLPSNMIYSMVIDDAENIWLATEGGLVKFNGKVWTTFPLTDFAIYKVAIDLNGNKWLGS